MDKQQEALDWKILSMAELVVGTLGTTQPQESYFGDSDESLGTYEGNGLKITKKSSVSDKYYLSHKDVNIEYNGQIVFSMHTCNKYDAPVNAQVNLPGEWRDKLESVHIRAKASKEK